MAVQKNNKVKAYWSVDLSKKINKAHDMHNGIVDVWSNPNIYNPGHTSGKYLSTPVPKYYRNKYHVPRNTPVLWNIPPDLIITADSHNKLNNDVQGMIDNFIELEADLSEINELTPVVAKASTTTTQSFNNIETVLNNLITWMNNLNWFDAEGLCIRSCQLNCQVGCQVGCQTCVTAQCHNQNCGTS